MKKALAVLPMVAILAACGTTTGGGADRFEKRTEQNRERSERFAERAIDKAPDWMTALPKSNSAIYQNGTATSPDMSMSSAKAKAVALGKLCMSAGGRVNQQSKIYRLDGEVSSSEHSEMAIRSFCPTVDISGVETVEQKIIAEGTRFRTYVLLALPTGEANQVTSLRDQRADRPAGLRVGQ